LYRTEIRKDEKSLVNLIRKILGFMEKTAGRISRRGKSKSMSLACQQFNKSGFNLK
jgi:hypothetical protein